MSFSQSPVLTGFLVQCALIGKALGAGEWEAGARGGNRPDSVQKFSLVLFIFPLVIFFIFSPLHLCVCSYFVALLAAIY